MQSDMPASPGAAASPGRAKVARPKALPVLSSLSVTPSAVYTLIEARNPLREAIQGHRHLANYGLGSGQVSAVQEDRDMLKDIREQMETWIDAYGSENSNDNNDDEADGMGTDEEYDLGAGNTDDGLDWDL